MRLLIFLPIYAVFIFRGPLFAQLADDFSDGDISANPAWAGETDKVFVNAAFELQTQGETRTDTIYLSTPVSLSGETEWRIYIRYGFAPSTSNFVRIYLASDQSQLEGSLNGYFVQIGEAGNGDSYDLYRQDGLSQTKIIDGIAGRAATGIDALVRVVRDTLGKWELSIDTGQNGSFEIQGTGMDTAHSISTYTGIWIKHTSTRRDAFFFDDVYAGNIIQDTLPPDIQSVAVISNSELELSFSEPLDSISARDMNNYLLTPAIGKPQKVVWESMNPAKVELAFPVSMINHTNYTLTVSGVRDLPGNVHANAQLISFEYLELSDPLTKDVIINEIMADPVPVKGLPEAEYLELYNRSGKTFDLAGWTIASGSTIGTLPAHIFRPGEYLILTDAPDAAKFLAFGSVISPDKWPALVNGGTSLSLRSPGRISPVDTLSYKQNWYNDEVKKEGGYSLELIYPDNLNLSCSDRSNWSASVHAKGGTPGVSNSILSLGPETTPPELVSFHVFGLDPGQILLQFSENVWFSQSDFSIDQGIGNPDRVVYPGPDGGYVVLVFDLGLQEGTRYVLSIRNVRDCHGNIMATATVEILLGRVAQPFEIVFSEIFPDPSPQFGLPEAEFAEIYNRTQDLLDLSQFIFQRRNSAVSLGTAQLLPGEYAILCDQEDEADFEAFGKTIGIEGFPSLNNRTDTLFLLNFQGETIDYVFYGENWYQDPAKADGGWTLERIDPDVVDCNQQDNWRASDEVRGGTPGQINSVDGTYTDNLPPEIFATRIRGDHVLEIVFSEQMEAGTLADNTHYILDEGVGEPLLAVPAKPHFRSVQLTFDISFDPNVVYELEIKDIRDCNGNKLQTLLAFGVPQIPESGDVLINEILFNPYTGGSDFVEIANASGKVLDLIDLQIGEIFPGTDSIFNVDPMSSHSRLLLPGEIICLTRDVLHLRQTYLPPATAGFFQMSAFPTYDDASGECVILSKQGMVMDRFLYKDDYHFPTLEDDEGVSLERISLRRPTQDPSNWHSAASTVYFATPGYPNSQMLDMTRGEGAVFLGKQVFSPDLDGLDDVLSINYDFGFPGANARVSVLDSHGRLIKTVAQNTLLGTEAGSFYWDGSDNKQTKADVGMYVVLFEVTNQQTGEYMVYRLVAVLAARF